MRPAGFQQTCRITFPVLVFISKRGLVLVQWGFTPRDWGPTSALAPTNGQKSLVGGWESTAGNENELRKERNRAEGGGIDK